MFTKMIAAGQARQTVLLASGPALLSQAVSASPSSSAGLEFPVIMRQNVTAGATPAGTKVQAKLAVATLVNGVVVPQDAILSGEVTESVAKSATGPSRLAIRMDSAAWTNRPAPTVLQFKEKVYLTAWYYPAGIPSAQDLSNQAADAAELRHRNAGPTYPIPDSPASQPFPGRNLNRNEDPRSASPRVSQHRVVMKDVESARTNEGVVTLSSKRASIKLDKTTTYVFATGDLARN